MKTSLLPAEFRHAHRWLAAALCAGVLLAQQPTTFRADVNLVHVVTTVKTQDGQIVGTLAKNEFEVYDNGAKQQIAVFEHQTEQALSVILMVDTSGSTAKELKYEADSASRFFHVLLGEGNLQDTAALYTFNWEVREQQPYTRDEGARRASQIAPRRSRNRHVRCHISGCPAFGASSGPQSHRGGHRWRRYG